MKSEIQWRFWAVLILCIAALGCGKQAPTKSIEGKPEVDDSAVEGATQPSNWQPGMAMLDHLADETVIDGYTVRPPKNYVRVTTGKTPPGVRIVAWRGPQRADGTGAAFTVTIVTPPRGQAIPSLEHALSLALEPVKERNWSTAAGERGTINGMTFLRARWNGTEPKKGWIMHGTVFVTMDWETMITMIIQDIEPYHAQAIAIGEAAALTIRKK